MIRKDLPLTLKLIVIMYERPAHTRKNPILAHRVKMHIFMAI